MSEEQKQQILSLLNEVSTEELMSQVDTYDESLREEVEWNMIDDNHWLVEEVFESVLEEDYDYNEIVANLFGEAK
jgi:hypothetical protein